MCVPQPIDECLRLLGDALCHSAAMPPIFSIHAARNAEHSARLPIARSLFSVLFQSWLLLSHAVARHSLGPSTRRSIL